MMHLRCDFFADTLGLSTSMTVLLPQPAAEQIGLAGKVADTPPPVLYLLHGLSDDDTIWLRRTSIERYASELGIAVVMPQVHRSFYSNMAHGGGRYWDFIAEELPGLVARSFHISNRVEDTFVAGLSMGGFGAFKLALHHPDRFAAAGSLSGVLDVASLAAQGERSELIGNVWGEPGPSADDDLIAQLGRVDPKQMPDLWATCGTDDALIGHQRRFVEVAGQRGIAIAADEHPGTHEWGFWDTHIQRFLAWLPIA